MGTNTDQQPPVRVATVKVDVRALPQEQMGQNAHLRKENATLREEITHLKDKVETFTNQAAAFKELIQQLKDEIAILKGQKPKPQFPRNRS